MSLPQSSQTSISPTIELIDEDDLEEANPIDLIEMIVRLKKSKRAYADKLISWNKCS